MIAIIVVLLLVFLGFAAVGQTFFNKSYLRKMDALIGEYEKAWFETEDEKERAKRSLKIKLIELKAKILSDAKSTEIAADKIAIL